MQRKSATKKLTTRILGNRRASTADKKGVKRKHEVEAPHGPKKRKQKGELPAKGALRKRAKKPSPRLKRT